MSEKSMRLLGAVAALGLEVGVAGFAADASAKTDALSTALACAVGDPAAQAALSVNTIESLQAYLAASPDGLCREQILAALLEQIAPAAGPAPAAGGTPGATAGGGQGGRGGGSVSVY